MQFEGHYACLLLSVHIDRDTRTHTQSADLCTKLDSTAHSTSHTHTHTMRTATHHVHYFAALVFRVFFFYFVCALLSLSFRFQVFVFAISTNLIIDVFRFLNVEFSVKLRCDSVIDGKLQHQFSTERIRKRANINKQTGSMLCTNAYSQFCYSKKWWGFLSLLPLPMHWLVKINQNAFTPHKYLCYSNANMSQFEANYPFLLIFNLSTLHWT